MPNSSIFTWPFLLFLGKELGLTLHGVFPLLCYGYSLLRVAMAIPVAMLLAMRVAAPRRNRSSVYHTANRPAMQQSRITQCSTHADTTSLA